MLIQFSVIVPCYNTEKTVISTLDSIKNQTYQNFEIIAVNDGSTDNTLNILETYKLHNGINLKVINQENKGLGGARNTGIREAQGTYIAFLDADDLWYPEKLFRVMQILSKNPEINIVCHDEDVLKNERILRRNFYGPFKTYEKLLFKENCLSPSAVVVNRKILLDVGLFSEDRSIHGVEDYDLWLKLARKGAVFYYLHEILGAYVLHEGNMSADIISFFKRTICLINKHLEAYPKKDFLFGVKSRIRLGVELRSCSRALLLSDDVKNARRFAVQSFLHYPISLKTIVVLYSCFMFGKLGSEILKYR